MALTRRQFLKRTGIGVAAATGGIDLARRAHAPSKAHASTGAVALEMKYTTCTICACNCGMRAFVRNGVLVKLEGNPACHTSQGRLCGKGQAGVGFLYDPDRLKHPLVRTNPSKGRGVDPKWRKVGWEEALDIVAIKMREAIDSHGPESILYVGKRRAGDLMAAIGSPNVVTHNSTCNVTSMIGHQESFGSPTTFADLDHCNYLLSFGWDMPGKGKNFYLKRYADFIDRPGTKTVCFDPRLSYTAAKADEWIPIRPGGDLPVALAMIRLIIKEGLYDRDYVEKYTVGFDAVREAVRNYTPEWAASRSDVPAETITRIAREFAGNGPAAIPVYKRHYNVRRGNFSLVQASNILVAITGNFERAGGIVLSRGIPLASLRPPRTPNPIDPRVRRIDGSDRPEFASGLLPFGMQQTLPDAILRNDPYEIRFGMINHQSLFSFGDVNRATEAFCKIPFLVNVNVLPDEIAMLADVVLPESTYLETSGIETSNTRLRGEIKVRQPVVPPLHDTRSFGSIKHALADRLGLSEYMMPIGERALDARLEPLGISFADLKEIGVFSAEGEWKERDKDALSTSSGKIHLTWESMSAHGVAATLGFEDHYESEPNQDYPFYIVTNRSPLHRHNTTRNIGWISEIHSENYLDINTGKARELGIEQGDMVRVSSPHGSVTIRARLTEGIRPDTVCMPHGFGQWSPLLRVAFGQGANDGELLPSFNLREMLDARDPSGNAADNEVFVRVEKVHGAIGMLGGGSS